MKNSNQSENEFSIKAEIVQEIANLIHLNVNDDLAEVFSHQFSEIIAYFQQLDSIDTNDVLPANEISKLKNITREDKITSSISRDQFFKNVPNKEGLLVRIPRISNIK